MQNDFLFDKHNSNPISYNSYLLLNIYMISISLILLTGLEYSLNLGQKQIALSVRNRRPLNYIMGRIRLIGKGDDVSAYSDTDCRWVISNTSLEVFYQSKVVTCPSRSKSNYWFRFRVINVFNHLRIGSGSSQEGDRVIRMDLFRQRKGVGKSWLGISIERLAIIWILVSSFYENRPLGFCTSNTIYILLMLLHAYFFRSL